MNRSNATLAEPLFLLALVPFLLSSIVWAHEALWFTSTRAAEALELLAFVAAVATAIYVPSLLVLSSVKRQPQLILLSSVFVVASLLLAKYSVIAFVNLNYSTELRAYTSTVAVAASKRGLIFVLGAAAIPLLLVPLIKLRARLELRHR